MFKSCFDSIFVTGINTDRNLACPPKAIFRKLITNCFILLNMEFTEICKPFDSLTLKELYAILRLRSEIFVVEQNCVFLDADNKDLSCQHLLLYQHKELVAYARIVPPGLSYTLPSIGRIVSSNAVRGKGFGKQLVKLAIENCQRLYGKKQIKISAQVYLKAFYESFGFVPAGDIYKEDGIDHVQMIRPEE